MHTMLHCACTPCAVQCIPTWTRQLMQLTWGSCRPAPDHQGWQSHGHIEEVETWELLGARGEHPAGACSAVVPVACAHHP